MSKYKFFSSSMLFLFLAILSVSLCAGKPSKGISRIKIDINETSAAPGADNPISNPEEFGSSFLFKEKTSKEIFDLNKKTKGKDISFLKSQAALGNAYPMFLLGQLEEKAGNHDSAFSWYVISFCVEFMTYPHGIKKNNELKEKIRNKINFSKEHEKFLQAFFKNFDQNILDGETIISNRHFLAESICFGFQESQFYEKKLLSFMVELFKFNAKKHAEKDKAKIQISMLSCSTIFYNRKDYDCYAYCLRFCSENDLALSNYINLIINKNIHVDFDGNPFSEENTDQVLANILLKIEKPNKDQFFCIGNHIYSGIIKKINGKKIDNKNEEASLYYRKSANGNSFYALALMISAGKTNKDEAGCAFEPNEKYNVVAKLLKKVDQDSPNYKKALTHLALLYYKNKIEFSGSEQSKLEYIIATLKDTFDQKESKSLFARIILNGHTNKDQNDKQIKDEEKIKIVADLLCESRAIKDIYLLASLILYDNLDPAYGLKILDMEANNLTKYQIAIELYKKSDYPFALYKLAILILHGYIHEDDKGKKIEQESRLEKVKELLQRSNTKNSMQLLSILTFQPCIELCSKFFLESTDLNSFSEDKDFCKKENLIQILHHANESLYYIKKALMLGHEDVHSVLFFLDEKIHQLELLLSSQESNKFGVPSQNNISDSNSSDRTSAPDIVSTNPLEMDSTLTNNPDAKNQEILKDKIKSSDIKKAEKRRKAVSVLFNRDTKIELMKEEDKKCHTVKKYKIQWSKKSEKDFHKLNPKECKKFEELINDIQEMGLLNGSGQPKKLSTCDAYSRKIGDKHRLVYKVVDCDTLEIISCEGHYDLIVEHK